MDLGLQDRRVLVTGGTRGIGRAVVTAFAGQGARVHTCYRGDAEAAARLGKDLAALGARYRIDRADLGVPEQARALVADAADHLGGLDVLVHNAAVVGRSPLAETGRAEWDEIMDVNLGGMYEVTRAALDVLAPGASVVVVSSAVATRGMAGRVAYTASKAACVGFVRSLCKELGPRGIRVNSVAPGIVETESGLSPAARERYTGMAALGRVGVPEDIAGAVAFLASDLAAYVTGQTLVVDGGI
ncbi:SDR family NAD(P)-dependent oxidoreductase [Actinomadura kijaniata]|uniref:SDR family NAD(P)-dependent oxidoreductase n=1 Tax=Actinomadura kijaniata TaxID=46161 RepID=UPI003F1988F3